MARINLLPWRAERRNQRQKEFYAMLGAAAVVAFVLSWGIVTYYSGQIAGQNVRNAYLQQQIRQVDQQIKEIEELDRKRARLLARKEVIEQLQANRSQMVHLFDELVRTIPDGVQLTSIKQTGSLLTIDGRVQSNARVSDYMRNIEASGWMSRPDLSIIEARDGDKSLPYVFSLRVTMSTPKKPQEDQQVASVAGGAR